MGDTEDTVDMEDTVARETLKLNLKPGAPLVTDTVPDMVLEDMEVMVLALPAMEVTVLALPAMEVTVLDTVSGRDLLMPGMDVDMEVMVDTDTVDTVERDLLMPDTDVTTVDTEDTDTVDMLTESNSVAQSTCYHLY